MRSFFSAFFALALVTPAFAAEEPSKWWEFYKKTIDAHWYVGGNHVTSGPKNSACYARMDFKDGSSTEITRDLVDDELYIRLQNLNWSLERDRDDKMQLRLNLQRGGNVIDGATMDWFMVDKSTIVIRAIKVKPFLEALWKSDTIRVVMPGDVPNATIPVGRAREVVSALAECVKRFAPLDKPPIPDIKPAPKKDGI